MTDSTVSTAIPSSPAADLLAILQRQGALYQQLHALASRQGELVDHQPEDLLTLLGQRQRLIDQLLAANGAMETYRNRWPACTEALAPEERRQVNDLISQINAWRDAIRKLDDADVSRLSHSRQALASDLAKVRQSGHAARAYQGTAGPVDARFADRRG